MAIAPLGPPSVDRSVIDQQPREMRGSDIWSELGYGLTLTGRFFRHGPVVAILLAVGVVAASIVAGLLTVQTVVIGSRIVDALIARDAAAVWRAIFTTFLIAAGAITANAGIWASTYAIQIRWRTAIVVPLVDRWMANRRYHALSWYGELENPEQRIQEDVSLIVERGLNLVTFFLSIMSSMIPFVGLLWGLSGIVSLRPLGLPLDLYGSMFWAALFWGILWTWIAHKIGRPYQRYEVTRQHLEADYRRALARVRLSSEAIAFERGDENERQRIQGEYRLIRENWFWFSFYGTRLLTMQSFEGAMAVRLPTLLSVPLILGGSMTVGQLTIAAGAFNSVIQGTTWFVGYYKSIAEWLASTQRVRLLEDLMDAPLPPGATYLVSDDDAIRICDLCIDYPAGGRLVTVDDLTIRQGERLLLQGRSGSGKSTFFRAMAGIWPFAAGSVALPADRRIMYLPQRSYMPEGLLRAALTYPQPLQNFDDAAIRSAMAAVGLEKFVDRLDELSDWSRRLSIGEQQRVAAVRAILIRPDILFLDEATSALDAGLEAQLYGALVAAIPEASIISIAHRSSVAEFHNGALEVAAGTLRRKA